MKTQNIVGQETLVKEISRIFEIFKASESEVRPHFILTGSSGSGKTFLIKEIAKSLEIISKRVDNISDFEKVFSEFKEIKGTKLIEVLIEKNDCPKLLRR